MGKITITEAQLTQMIKNVLTEMALTPRSIEKGAALVTQVNNAFAELQQITGEKNPALLDLRDNDYALVYFKKLPKMYKNNMVVFSLVSSYNKQEEVYKCSFDKEKYDDFYGDYYNAGKELKNLLRMIENAKREHQEYDPNYDDTPNQKRFYSALRSGKPFEAQ